MNILSIGLLEIIIIIFGIISLIFCLTTVKNLKKFFSKKPKIVILVIVFMLLFFVPTCINLVYKIGADGYILVYTDITVNSMIGFYGGVLSFIGTASLGALALWQNERLTKQNQEYSKAITEQQEEKNKLLRTELIKPKFLITSGGNSSNGKFDIKIINNKSYDINNMKFHNNIDESIKLKENIPTNIKGSEFSILTLYICNKVKAINNKSYTFLISCEDEEQNEYYYKHIFSYNSPFWTSEEQEEINKNEFEEKCVK